MLFHKATATDPSRRRFTSLPYLWDKLWEKGLLGLPRWFADRIAAMAERGTRPVRARFWARAESRLRIDAEPDDLLYAFYDLEVSNETFDVVTFLGAADAARQQHGCSALHLVIVPATTGDGFVDDFFKLYDTPEKRWRLRHILQPAASLLPACVGVSVCPSRRHATMLSRNLCEPRFPTEYTPSLPINSSSWAEINSANAAGLSPNAIRASEVAKNHVERWLSSRACDRKVLVITLRECHYTPERNSNLAAWGRFLHALDQRVYALVILRDLATAVDPPPAEFPDCLYFPEAVWNLELRAALYERAYLNLTINNGPSMLLYLNPLCRYLSFKLVTSSCAPTTPEYFKRVGLPIGSQPAVATDFQRLVWQDDEEATLHQEFQSMVGIIEAASFPRVGGSL
jgi:hypothetical protein